MFIGVFLKKNDNSNVFLIYYLILKYKFITCLKNIYSELQTGKKGIHLGGGHGQKINLFRLVFGGGGGGLGLLDVFLKILRAKKNAE